VLRFASEVARDAHKRQEFERRILRVEAQNGRYVIVATNVIEMGLTFPSLDYVVTVDTELSARGGLLTATPLGVNAFFQRIGRVGRARAGQPSSPARRAAPPGPPGRPIAWPPTSCWSPSASRPRGRQRAAARAGEPLECRRRRSQGTSATSRCPPTRRTTHPSQPSFVPSATASAPPASSMRWHRRGDAAQVGVALDAGFAPAPLAPKAERALRFIDLRHRCIALDPTSELLSVYHIVRHFHDPFKGPLLPDATTRRPTGVPPMTRRAGPSG
jgi:hypothetical protein